MPKVLCLTSPSLPLGDLAREQLPPGWTICVMDRSDDDAEKVEAVRDADFIFSCAHNVGEDLLRAGKNVKIVQLASAGWDRIDVRLAGELGIPRRQQWRSKRHPRRGIRPDADHGDVSQPSSRRPSQSETTTGITATCWDRNCSARSSESWAPAGLVRCWQGSSADLRPLPYIATSIRSHNIEQVGARRVDLDELMSTSDVVSLHVPLMPSTDGLIGARELGLMKPTANPDQHVQGASR